MPAVFSQPRIREDQEKEELQTVLRSGILKRAPNLQHFLEFVAEEYFAGTADQLKEYSIAVHALHRPEKFDPQSDTIVRVTAHALRKKLEQYYSADGANHEIKIQLPAGKYVLQFVRKTPETPALPDERETSTVDPQELDFHAESPASKGALRLHPAWKWYGVAAACVLIAVILYIDRQRHTPPTPRAGNVAVASDSETVLRLRFGDSPGPYLDAAGRSWMSNQYCKGGQPFANPSHDIQGTDDPAIFREGRKGKFLCRIPAPPGTYQLLLLFADTAGDKVGAGQVDFSINERVAGALDIVDEAGGNDIAVGKVYEGIHPMSDGTIHLDFTSDDSFVNAAELTRSASEIGPPLRMLAGPAVFHDDGGNVWSPEQFFLGGRRTSHQDTLPNAANAKLYDWERYGHFRYMLPVVPGRDYTVRMYFYEGWFGAKNGGPGGVGSRVFDVYCNGSVLLKDFDISKEASSGTTTMTIHHVKPTAHGVLEINFTPVKNYPLINAIEIIPER
jgi:hypothetical protein